jgi:hypothetical protein
MLAALSVWGPIAAAAIPKTGRAAWLYIGVPRNALVLARYKEPRDEKIVMVWQ